MPSNVLKKVEESLAHLVKRLNETYGPSEVYLFGSFAKGEWLEDSDVDIVAISKGFEGKPMPERVKMVRVLAPKDIALEILPYTPEELEEALVKSITIQDASTYWKKVTSK